MLKKKKQRCRESNPDTLDVPKTPVRLLPYLYSKYNIDIITPI